MKAPAFQHALIEASSEKGAIVIEPSLGFEKGEKDEAGHIQQRDLGTVVGAAIERRARHVADDALERPIKAPRERLTSENLDPPRVREYILVAARGRERAQRLGVAVNQSPTVGDERGDARTRALATPRGDGNVMATCRMSRQHEPQNVWRSGRELRRDAWNEVAQRCVGRDFDQERAKAATAARDTRRDYRRPNAKMPASIVVECLR